MKYLKTYEEISLYHGGGKRFKNFDLNKSKTDMSKTTYGYGIYLTDIEDVAKIYSSEYDKQYIYHITVHKGKNPNEYDYLIFESELTNKQISKIHEGTLKENIDIDFTNIKTGFDIMKCLWDYFYDKMDMKSQINNGYANAKKLTSLFLLRCGIDGLKYKMPNNILSHEKGYDGYNYVIFDDKNIFIDKINKLQLLRLNS